jgi:DNA-binding transcriptional LysR family regulator
MERGYQRLTLHQLRIFSAVARLRSYAQAATALGLTPPAVSARMRELAAILGVPILEVVGKRMHLTSAGKALEKHAARLNEQFDELAHEFSALRAGETGAVRVGAGTALGNYLLPSLVAEFVPAHPRLEVSLRIDNSAAIVEWLLQNEVDLGFIGSPVNATTLVATPYFEDEIVFACAPGHPLAAAGTVPLSRIVASRCLVRERGSSTRRAVEERLYERELQLERPVEIGGIEAIKQAVIAGLGVSWFSLITVRRDLESGALVRIPVEGLSLRRSFFLVGRRSKHVVPAIRAFSEFAESRRPASR